MPTGRAITATSPLRKWNRKKRHTRPTISSCWARPHPNASDRAVDQRSAVIGDLDLHTLRKSRPDLLQSGLHIADHAAGIRAGAHHDDAADRLALPVPLGQPAAALRPQAHPRNILQQNRGAVGAHSETDPAEIVHGPDVPESPDHELLLGDLDQAAADVAVAVLNGGTDRGDRQVVRTQPVRVYRDLVLAHEATHTGNFGNPGDGRQLVLQEPVLDRAQFTEVVAVGT